MRFDGYLLWLLNIFVFIASKSEILTTTVIACFFK